MFFRLVLFSSLFLIILVGCRNVDRNYVIPHNGDMNGDGILDQADIDILKELIGVSPDISEPFPYHGDLDGDLDVDLIDLSILVDLIDATIQCNKALCIIRFEHSHEENYDDESDEDDNEEYDHENEDEDDEDDHEEDHNEETEE